VLKRERRSNTQAVHQTIVIAAVYEHSISLGLLQCSIELLRGEVFSSLQRAVGISYAARRRGKGKGTS